VHDGIATILLADSTAIERLICEGGLRSSFLGFFRSSSVLDTAASARADAARDLDRLLATCPLVACDQRLIDPVDDTSPNAAALTKYRVNFLGKLSRRRLMWLAVLEGEKQQQLATVDQCRKAASTLAGADPYCMCEVIVVATEGIDADIYEALEGLRGMPALSRIYLMSKWLQSGRETQHVVLAENVWPECVARLLAVRALSGRPSWERRPTRADMLAWRTFAWGTLPPSTSPSSWQAAYMHTLRDLLMPPVDDSSHGDSPERAAGDARVGSAAAPPALPTLLWTLREDQIRRVGSAATDPILIQQMTHDACHHAAQANAAHPHRDAFEGQVKAAWSDVATADGLESLRRIREGRIWRAYPLAAMERAQRTRWRECTESTRAAGAARARHGQAVTELARARSRHLPLAWHAIIAALILPFLIQFLLGILLPLRPDGPASDAPLFATPRAVGKSVAYLVDHSSSMDGLRLERMKSDLKAAIQKLPDGTEFTVLAFNEAIQELPGANGAMIAASDSSRSTAIDWIDSLTAEGTTTASQGLRQLVSLHPESIAFLTDGLLSDGDRLEVAEILSDKQLIDDIRIDTLMLYTAGEEQALRDLARATGGSFRRVSFDPFTPPGFGSALLIILGATVCGVTLGAWLPWVLERRAGRRATETLGERLRGLLHEYSRVAHDTATSLAESERLRSALRSNRLWIYQSQLAGRALQQVEESLASPARFHEPPPSASKAVVANDPLAIEDRADLHDTLDEPMPDASSAARLDSKTHEIATVHAEKLRTLWQELAHAEDCYTRGHLPVWAIGRRFDDAVGDCLADASLQLLLPHSEMSENRTQERDLFVTLCRNVAGRVSDDVHRPFLSVPVVAPSGSMPSRSFAWFSTRSGTAPLDLDELVGTYFEHNTSIRFAVRHSVPDVGLRALGLIHDELPVEARRREDGRIEFIVGEDRS
jgi:hypothetical protein